MLTFIAIVLPLVAAAPSRKWLQPIDSPVASLFKRSVPDPSSSNYTSYYPTTYATPDNSTIPQAWLDKLNSVTIPDVGVSTQSDGMTTYPNNENGLDSTICSFTWGCVGSTDLFDAPDNIFALTFDDGPTDASPTLYNFLESNNISSHATHFMIGTNIVLAPSELLTAFDNGGHIAVHTWSHPYMTSLSTEGVVGEIGWTMQIISDLTGGRLPAFWRPPYGDVDNRVRAIAKEVFGLETVLWNHDTNDWAIGDEPGYTQASVEATMQTWLTGTKTPGILALEHELTNDTVDVFMTEYPSMVSNGWTIMSVPDAFGLDWYQNALGNQGDITSTMSVGQIQTNIFTNATAPTSTSASSASSTSSSVTTTSANASKSNIGGQAAATSSSSSKSSASSQLAIPSFLLLISFVMLAL